MKLQRTTVIVLALAAALGGFVFFYEIQSKPYREAAQNQAKQLFPFEEIDVQALTIRTETETLVFERAAASPTQDKAAEEASPEASPELEEQPVPTETSQWLMTQPERQPANAATIAFLLNLLATDTPSKTFTAPASQLPEFGLQPPRTTVAVTLANQRRHTLYLGTSDFNRSALYALVDPPASLPQEVKVALVSISFETAVQRSLAEWLAETNPLPDPPLPPPTP